MPASTTRLYALFLAVLLLLGSVLSARAADGPAVFPLSDVKPGMRGVAYTIFEGDQVEKVDLEVIGILNNAVGPKQDVILVRLLGDKVQETGVVAGMSGSPVYIDGKLVGALALKLGTFTKEAIGGVTPIESMLEVERLPLSRAPVASRLHPTGRAKDSTSGAPTAALIPGAYGIPIPLPDEFAERVAAGSGQMLVPIETPLVAAGLYPQTLAYFGKRFSSWGMTVMAGGTVAPSPEDAQLKPGDMVGFDLIRGDLSLSSGCTVTTVDGPLILACGHSLFGFGRVEVPLSRAHVLMTLASSQASTKIITTSGTIGTLTQDRQTAVMGKLGAGPPMIPVDVILETPSANKKYHFEVIESPQLAPTLVATAVYNGIIGSPVYGEGSTLELDGTIDVEGHTSVELEDLFAPTDQPVPAGFFVATDVQSAFAEIYSNPYEVPQIKRVDLHVKALADRRWATIDNAWVEKSEVHPGETVAVKVLLRPYRGEPFIQEIPVTIPAQAARGTLELAVSDAEFLNRNVQQLTATSQGQLAGLEELIQLLNRERHNDRLYATLLQPTPTMLVEDKEMPNVPASAINVFDERSNLGDARLLWQSTVGEWSVEMHQLIAGQRMLAITVK
jgi:SpoIVB peptidase S55